MRDDDTRIVDCFLSHNSRDKPEVRKLAARLRAAGLSVWLDEDDLRPGVPWQTELESAIRASRSVAVLVGADGLGPWEIEEQQAALDLAARDKLSVIPILLPDAPEAPQLPMFLSNRTWVDLRRGKAVDDSDAINRLIWGITGRNPQARTSIGIGAASKFNGAEASHPFNSQCANAEVQALSCALKDAYAEEKRLICEEEDTEEVRSRILDLRRRVREGGRLRAGDFLLHGRYQLLEELGSGSFAIIFKAFDEVRRQLVAIKVLHSVHVDDQSRIARFSRKSRRAFITAKHGTGSYGFIDHRGVLP